MSRRLPHSLGALAAVLAAMSLPAVSVAGQATAPAAKTAAAKPEAAKIRAARAEADARFVAGLPDDVEDFSLPVRCIIRTDSPPYLPTIYNNDFQIFQSPGFVVIQPEMIHSARVIPVDGRPHLTKNIKLWLGDTR